MPNLLILQLITVPFFILMISLAGKRWGGELAGKLSALPVVAGPIVFFLILDQGTDYGFNASISAIYGCIGILVFGLVYCWASQHFRYLTCLMFATLAWVIVSYFLTLFPTHLALACGLTILFLVFTPKLLPRVVHEKPLPQSLKDLPFRLVVGGLLAFLTIVFGNLLGSVWVGILSTFPINSLVLTVFTHKTFGQEHVIPIYRGLTKGLLSFVAYFAVQTVLIKNMPLWLVTVLSILAAIIIQLMIQQLLKKQAHHSAQ